MIARPNTGSGLLTYVSDAVSGFMQDMELDADGNVAHTTDFRRVYASLIEGWFGYQDSRALLSGDFSPLAMFG